MGFSGVLRSDDVLVIFDGKAFSGGLLVKMISETRNWKVVDLDLDLDADGSSILIP